MKRTTRSRAGETASRRGVGARTTTTDLRDRQDGQTISEYALLIAAFVVLLIVTMMFLAGKIDNLFTKAGTNPSVLKPPVAKCDPNYSGACVPLYPPDLDCSDLEKLGIGAVKVVGSDPHDLDPDGDGIGCD